jgi:hypothetical protein
VEEKCLDCGRMVSIGLLREHLERCDGGPSWKVASGSPSLGSRSASPMSRSSSPIGGVSMGKPKTYLDYAHIYISTSTRHIVAAVPSWEPETVNMLPWEPEAVNRKGLQMTKSLEASPPLKNWR